MPTEGTMYPFAMGAIALIGLVVAGIVLDRKAGLSAEERAHVVAEQLLLVHAAAVRHCAASAPPSECGAGTISLPSDQGPLANDPRRSRFRSVHDGDGLVVSWFEHADARAGHGRLGEEVLDALVASPFAGGWLGRKSEGGATLRAASEGRVRSGNERAENALTLSAAQAQAIPNGAPIVASRFR